MIPATAAKCSRFSTANTVSTCITRYFSLKPKPAVYSRPGFVPVMLRPQRQSPLSLAGWFPGLNRRFPKSQISYRADAGSATPEIYQSLESLELLYAIGIGSNAVFQRKTERWLTQAQRKYARTKKPVRVFCSFRHRARSWEKKRRIVVKIEVGAVGSNLRYVITNRPGTAQAIFNGDDDRGQCENRIKEFKCDLSAERLSCHRYRANAFRLQLHALAYQLLVLFCRHALQTTQIAHARLETLRLKPFKVGSRFKRTARHLWFHLSSSWPERDLFVEVWRKLQRLPRAAPS
jgi:hypothetical protein